MAKKKEVKKAAAPQATEEIVVVKKPRVKPIGKPVKNEVAKAEAAPVAKAAPAARTKKVAAAPVVNLYRAEVFIKKGEQFNEVFVGAGSYDEALSKVNATELVAKKGAEIQSLYKVNNDANPNIIYLP